jgi:formylmethanofuran--tetrahydromethanopterin N-formyltransferase
VFCPTLRGAIDHSELPPGVNAVYEIVIDGLTQDAVATAIHAGVRAACRPGVLGISAAHYGGKLGPHHFHLHKILELA